MDDRSPLALIIEDEPAIAQLLATILRMQGYQAQTALSGDAACDQLAAARPDLITLDLNLPGTSSAAILEQLRADPDTADLPVIVVSACPQIEPELAALVQGVLTKPFELDELIALVHEVAAAPQPAALQLNGHAL